LHTRDEARRIATIYWPELTSQRRSIRIILGGIFHNADVEGMPKENNDLTFEGMRLISSGKAAANERKYPYIVALSVAGRGLDIGLSRQITNFHNPRHIKPRHGRNVVSTGGGEAYYRWCFSDLETAQSFAEQFGGKIQHAG
jgi:hypothetical protein